MSFFNGIFRRRCALDLHVHTDAVKNDSIIKPEEVIQAIQRKKSLDGVCITDHNTMEGANKTASLAQKSNVLVLKGVEVMTPIGEILVYGLNRSFPSSGAPSALNLVKTAKSHGAFVVVPHPFRGFKGLCNHLEKKSEVVEILKLADAIEVLNGAATEEENKRAKALARKFNKPGAGGSDAHKPHEIGQVLTVFNRNITSIPQLFDEIKAQNFRIEPG